MENTHTSGIFGIAVKFVTYCNWLASKQNVFNLLKFRKVKIQKYVLNVYFAQASMFNSFITRLSLEGKQNFLS